MFADPHAQCIKRLYLGDLFYERSGTCCFLDLKKLS